MFCKGDIFILVAGGEHHGVASHEVEGLGQPPKELAGRRQFYAVAGRAALELRRVAARRVSDADGRVARVRWAGCLAAARRRGVRVG